MRKRRFYLLLIGVLALIGVLVWILSGPREPEYEGRKLSEWVSNLSPKSYYYSTRVETKSRSQVAKEAERAIRGMGTNAVPYLVRWIRYERPAWKEKTYQFLRKVLGKPSIGVRDDSEMIRAEGCVVGFRALGSEAAGAIEELSQIMNDPKSPQKAAAGAAFALAALGDDALPAFLSGATNKNSAVRMFVSNRCRFLIGHPNEEIKCTATNVLRALDPGALMEMELRSRVRPPPLLKIPNAREML